MEGFSSLLRASKLAQVATPISKLIRGGNQLIPTHQVIYTPKSLAIRSDYGIKTPLPKQVGYSHIAFNNIDNKTGMPDVEKATSKMYLRIRFQENGIELKQDYVEGNPLFKKDHLRSIHKPDSLSFLSGFNLSHLASPSEVRHILKKNPKLYRQFKAWYAHQYPEAYLGKTSGETDRAIGEFLEQNPNIVRKPLKLEDLKRDANGRTGSGAHVVGIQGTGGLSYGQKGRLTNTPNGYKYANIVAGRMVENSTAVVSGFATTLHSKNVMKQMNYAKNVPGHHARQFTMPFKVSHATMFLDGQVTLNVEGQKVGNWDNSSQGRNHGQKRFEALNPIFGSVEGRHSAQESEPLTRLLGVVNL